MPFQRPTLAELKARTRADVQTELGLGPLPRRSLLEGLTRAQAGAAHHLHGHLDFLARQLLPTTAEGIYLEEHARIRGIERKPAVPASGIVRMNGNGGALVPEGTLLRRADGVQFTVSADTTLTGGSADVPCEASEGGVATNTAEGTLLSLVNPLTGVRSPGTVQAPGLSGGLDVESDADMRARVLDAWRTPRGAGSSGDYVKWALEVPGVSRAWSYPNALGIGTVSVAFVTDADPISPIPTLEKVDEVALYIAERRPVTARVFVFGPVERLVDFEIQVYPDTPEVRAAIEQSLRDLFQREAQPGVRMYRSHIREAISSAVGEIDHVLTEPPADVVPTTGELLRVGTIAWITP